MNILLIHDKLPYPITSGADQRVFSLLTHLKSQGHNITLLVQSTPCINYFYFSRKTNINVVYFWRKSPYNIFLFLKRNVDIFFRKINFITIDEILIYFTKSSNKKSNNYWNKYQDGLDVFVFNICKILNIDTIIIEYIWIHKAIDKIKGKYLILDAIDVMYIRKQKIDSTGEYFPLEINRQLESEIYSKFSTIIAIQKAEFEVIKSMVPMRNVITAGVAFDNIYKYCEDNDKKNLVLNEPKKIIFVGGNNHPNMHGITRFLSCCWPLIKLNSKKNVQFIIAGNICNFLENFSKNDDKIKLLGVVSDLSSLYAEADLVINPVWTGSGLKIKTIEAFLHRKILVTTEVGIEGMEPKPSNICFVAHDDNEMSVIINKILNDEIDYSYYIKNINSYYEEYLTAKYVYKELDMLLSNLT